MFISIKNKNKYLDVHLVRMEDGNYGSILGVYKKPRIVEGQHTPRIDYIYKNPLQLFGTFQFFINNKEKKVELPIVVNCISGLRRTKFIMRLFPNEFIGFTDPQLMLQLENYKLRCEEQDKIIQDLKEKVIDINNQDLSAKKSIERVKENKELFKASITALPNWGNKEDK